MGLMKKLTSALVASSLVFSLVGTAFAGFTPAAGEIAGKRMVDLKMLQGRADGDLALNSEITRAELVTVIVRAFGKEEDAKLLKGSTIFPDIQNHWASGNIAMAVALVEKAGSDPIGMPDGTFAPDAKLTPAQAVAFLMKFVGVKADGTKTWPQNYLSVAVDKGLLTAEDSTVIAPMLNEHATRGLVFYLFDRAFISYQLPTGKTFYTEYVDTKAPELTVDAVAETTIDSKVTITGSVKDFTELYVGSAAVTPAADGKFSAEFALPEIKAEGYTIAVTALDLAGNKTEKTVKVTRTVGTAAKIEAPAAITVAAGASVDLTAAVLDANGNKVTDAEVALEETELGTYADGKFVAGDKVGTGTVTLKSGELTATVNVTITSGELASLELTTEPAVTTVSVGTPLKLVVTGKDAKGNVVEVSGVTFTATNGIVDAAGNFAATVSGSSVIKASVGSISKELTVNVFSAASKLAITNTKNLIANNTSTDTVTVAVQDANGFVVGTYNGKVTLTKVSTGDGVVIMDGTTADADNTLEVTAVNGIATFTVKAGTTVGTARFQATAGSLIGALKEISVVKPTIAKFEASVDVNQIAAHINAKATVTIKPVDAEGVSVAAGDSYKLTFVSDNTNALKFNGVTGNTTDVDFISTDTSKTLTLVGTAVPGVANLTATVKLGTTSVSVPVNTLTLTTAYAGAAAKLQLIGAENISLSATTTTAKSFKVAILDQAGNILSHLAAGVVTPTFSVKDANGVEKNGVLFTIGDATTAYQNGIFYKTIVPVNTVTTGNAGTFTLKVSGTDLTSTTGTVVVNPGAATAATNTVTLTADNLNVAGDGMSRVVLTAKVKDVRGNVVPFNGDVTLVRNSGTNLTMPATATVKAVDGVATFTLTAGYTFGADQYKVTLDLDGNGTVATGEESAALNISTVLTGSATKLGIEAATADAPVALTGKDAGEEYEVKVYVRDAQDNAATTAVDESKVVTSDNGRPISLVIVDGTGTVKEASATTVNGVATFHVTSTKSNTVTFRAEAAGLTKSANATAAFDPAAAAKIVLKAEAANIQSGSDVKVTASYVDQFGNAIPTATASPDLKNIQVAGNIGNLTATEASATVINATATGEFWLKAAAFPASGSITAEEDTTGTAVPVDSLAITVYDAGQAYKVQLQAVENVKAESTTEAFTVKATMVDYQGLTLTKYEGAVTEIPFKVSVKAPGATTYTATGVTATAFVNGVATFTFQNDGNGNAGTYTFKAEPLHTDAADYNVAPWNAAPYTADDQVLFAGLQTSTVTGDILPGDAAAVETALINVADGTENAAATTVGSAVSYVKVKVVDAKNNVVTSFNGTGKLTLSSASNVTLVGATNGVLSLNIVNGYAVAQIQVGNMADFAGTFTGAVILSGTSYTADATALTLAD